MKRPVDDTQNNAQIRSINENRGTFALQASLESSAKFYESLIEDLQTTQKNALGKSKVLRKAFYEDIDKYFNIIDERIERACRTGLKSFSNQNRSTMVSLKACVDLTAKMDNLLAKTDGEQFTQGEPLLNQVKLLLQSLADSSIDAVEIPQVRLERRQDWNLEGAVNLQLRRVQRRVGVSNILSQLHTY